MVLRKLEKTPETVACLEAINAEAFPENERIDISDMFAGIRGLDSAVLGLDDGGHIVGFISMLHSEACVYIGYLAVQKEYRARGFGGEALRQLASLYPKQQIVVDFEAPDDKAGNNDQRLKRRAFYLRNGFFPTGYYQWYMQTEFEIVCNQPEFDLESFRQVVAKIHACVPGFNPSQYRKQMPQNTP